MTTNFDGGSSVAAATNPTNINSITDGYLSPPQQHQSIDANNGHHHIRPPPPLVHYGAENGSATTTKAIVAGTASVTASGLVTFKGNTNGSNFTNMSNGNVNIGSDSNAGNGNDYNGSDKSVSIDGRNSRINNNINNNSVKESKENLLQNNYNDDDLGPLPPKWETAYTERGELYFIDHNTGTSHWLDPRLSKFQKKSLEDCTEDELPYGWEKIEDSLYGTYYIDHVNRRTQYENPVLEAKRRLAEQKQMRATTPSVNQNGDVGNPGIKAGELSGPQYNDGNNLVGKLSGNFYPPPKRDMQLPPPVSLSNHPVVGAANQRPLLAYKFTKNPEEMQGERITTNLVKSARGLGITIIGGDEGVDEFLQIKSIVPNGPAWFDGQLQTGDVLVYVNETCVLGFTHNEMVNIFQSIMPGDTVTLEVCRGYPLPFDPNDPNTEVVTTIAVNGINPPETEKHGHQFLKSELDGNYNFVDTLKNFHQSGGAANKLTKAEVLTFSIAKGVMGFGFTIADSAHGQRVKKILDRNCCTQLQEGDVLLEINDVDVRHKSHLDVVQILKDCSKTELTTVRIQRERSGSSGNVFSYATTLHSQTGLNSGNIGKLYNKFAGNGLGFRSKTPTADLYSTQQKEILPIRPKTPLVDTRRPRIKTPENELLDEDELKHKSTEKAKSTNSLHELNTLHQDIPYLDPYPKLVTTLSERLSESRMLGGASGRDVPDAYNSVSNAGFPKLSNHGASEMRYDFQPNSHSGAFGGVNYGNQDYQLYGSTSMPPILGTVEQPGQEYVTASACGGMTSHHLSNSNGSRLYSSFTPIYLTPTGGVHANYHHESCFCYECQEDPAKKYRQPMKQSPLYNYYGHHPLPSSSSLLAPLDNPCNPHQMSPMLRPAHPLQDPLMQNDRIQKRVNEIVNERRKVDFSPLESQLPQHNFLPYTPDHSPMVNLAASGSMQPATILSGQTRIGGSIGGGSTNGSIDADVQYELTTITLERQIMGFGFRIVGGTEEGSQVTVGHIVPGGAADNDHRIATGDEILSIDGINVVNASHHKVVSLMGEAALRGQVTMILRRRVLMPNVHLSMKANKRMSPSVESRFPYDVIVKRNENEGFGFVIISSSNQFYGSTIGKLIAGSPADRCGELKVGDRIIAVNQVDISSMSHGDVVNLIKESGLHVRLTIGCPKETPTGAVPGNPPVASNNPLLSNSAQPSPNSPAQSHSTSTNLPLQTEANAAANDSFNTASQPTQATQLKL